jgi:hypothetical protein
MTGRKPTMCHCIMIWGSKLFSLACGLAYLKPDDWSCHLEQQYSFIIYYAVFTVNKSYVAPKFLIC